MHDNSRRSGLYEKLGFERIPAFALKNKNAFNEPLFIGKQPEANLNPYATIIVTEARRRGIGVEVMDAEAGYFALVLGGRRIVCRESLSELTTAVAMSRCDDKAITHRLLKRTGLRVPEQTTGGGPRPGRGLSVAHGQRGGQAGPGRAGRGHQRRRARPRCPGEGDPRRHAASARRVILEEYVRGR